MLNAFHETGFLFALTLILAMAHLVGATSWASFPENCPPPANLTSENCSLPYNGIAILAGIVGLPSHRTLNNAADLLDEVTSGTDDLSCAPRLSEMTKKIEQGRKGCRKASFSDVREIIAEGNQNKVFCRREPNPKEIDYDLYNEKRIQNYVLTELHEHRPELCQ